MEKLPKEVLNILEKVKKNIINKKHIVKGDKIIVGVSGGADSICLLSILNLLKDKIGFEIEVAHINHGIRKESEEEERILLEKCADIGIKCNVLKVDIIKVASERKVSTETAGRDVRYEFFNKLVEEKGYSKIAIAHNLNDKTETVLLNLLRGSSIKGLIGIKEQYKNIIRPLLILTRDEIETYCKYSNLEYFTDKSNFEEIYTRNKVRLNLIPLIKKEYNPNISETINRLSISAQEDTEYMDEIAVNILKKCIIEEYETDKNKKIIEVNRKMYNDQNIAIRKRMITLLIEKACKSSQNIETVHINDIDNLIKVSVKNKIFEIGRRYTFEIQSKNTFSIVEK